MLFTHHRQSKTPRALQSSSKLKTFMSDLWRLPQNQNTNSTPDGFESLSTTKELSIHPFSWYHNTKKTLIKTVKKLSSLSQISLLLWKKIRIFAIVFVQCVSFTTLLPYCNASVPILVLFRNMSRHCDWHMLCTFQDQWYWVVQYMFKICWIGTKDGASDLNI